jgi:hypothetical protein
MIAAERAAGRGFGAMSEQIQTATERENAGENRDARAT